MRDEMMGAVVKRAIEHSQFRKELLQNPAQTLQTHGFVLEADEFAEIESLRSSPGRSDHETEDRLVALAERFGVDVEKLTNN